MPQFPSTSSASGIWSLKKQKRAQQGGNWPYPPISDFAFNYVTALFLGTSTNGAQNNTFLDGSTNNFTITRNGNTTQGSFSPYQPNGYWSNFFSGAGNYLQTPAGSANSLVGNLTTGASVNLAVECWIYPTAYNNTAGFPSLIGDMNPTAEVNYWSWGVTNTGTLRLYWYRGGQFGINTTSVVPLNTWTHIALNIASGVVSMYINGISQPLTSTSFSGPEGSLGYLTIGQWNNGTNGQYIGYVSNLRTIKASTYTSNFTPSTTPLTAVANTGFLTCQSNRFIDNSSNAVALTVGGTPSVLAFDPFGMPAQYSTPVNGGCGYFDGSGDYLTSPTGYLTGIGTGNFTIEGWWNFGDFTVRTTYFQRLWSFGTGLANDVTLNVDTSGNLIFRINDSIIASQSSGAMRLNSWNHVALVRSSGTVTIYLNGVSVASAANSSNLSTQASSPFYVGSESDGAGGYFFGYCSNLRITNSAVYTTAFTPPTSPVTGGTLLLNFTNGGIYNTAAQNTVETIGNAQVNTSVVKNVPSSMYFDGSGDNLSMPLNDVVQFRTDNFTIEMWVYPLSTNHQSACLFSQEHISAINAPISIAIWLNGGSFEAVGNRIGFGVYTGPNGSTWTVNAQNLATIPVNTWTHVALCRVGNVFTMFVNGNAVGSATNSTSCSLGSTQYWVGRRWDLYGSYPYFNGYMSEFRITRGYARYWYPFTPPALPMGTFYAPETQPASDPLYEYVTLLLPGNGTNGAQNNTFLDSSANAFTVTRNGNTTQGTFTPYGPNWSNFFGSGQYLSMADATQFNLAGGTYTIECWINPTGNYGNYNTILAKRSGDNASTFGWELYLRISTGVLSFASNYVGFESSVTPPANVWSHIAAVYDGTNINLYLNGTRVGQGAMPNNNVSASVFVGTYPTYSEQFLGYISNMRITKGAMLYTGASFTVPTGPLTTSVPSGTVSLLTCQGNRFVDASSNAAAIAVTGSPSVQRFSPFNPPASYSAATNGGSGYFDGSGDYLQWPGTVIGSGAFTIQFWIYSLNGFGTMRAPLGVPAISGYNSALDVRMQNTTINVSQYNVLNTNFTVPQMNANEWNHVAITRNSSNQLTVFLNGVRSSTGVLTLSTNFSGATSVVGRLDPNNGGDVTGYISGLQIITGSNIYDPTQTTITVPTTPPTAVSNTQLLLNYTNGGIIDNAMINDLETVGNAQISTTQSKFGGSSMYFDGSGDWLASPSSPLFSFDTNLTIECWIYPSAFSGVANAICGTSSGLNDGRTLFYVYNNGRLGIGKVGINEITSPAGTIATGTWYHVAVVRQGSLTTLYVNGAPVASATTDVWSTGASNFYVAYVHPSNGNTWNGYIDDLRVTRGVARYVQPFTPPTQAFQTS